MQTTFTALPDGAAVTADDSRPELGTRFVIDPPTVATIHAAVGVPCTDGKDRWSICSAGDIFTTREQAEQFLIDVANVRAAEILAGQAAGTSERAFSREQYERACAAVDVEAIPDEQIHGSYGLAHGVFSPPEYPAEMCVSTGLAVRRLGGIREEHEAADQRRITAVDQAMPGVKAYTREQYEQACVLAAVEPLTDRACDHVAHEQSITGQKTAAGILARRRLDGIAEQDMPMRICANPACRKAYPAGTGAVASTGTACSFTCYQQIELQS